MTRNNISLDQFGALYHGTDTAGISELDQTTNGGPRYSAMKKSYGYNYVTTGLQTAIDYARDASTRGGTPTVYDVSPRRKSEKWGPDPDSGPNGFSDGPRNKREALEVHENSGDQGVSLRFQSPLKVNKEVWVEHKSKDVTNGGIGASDRLTDFHTSGRSFS